MDLIKKCFFLLILLLLILPAFKGAFQSGSIAPMKGYYVPPKNPEFRRSDWYSGAFQDSLAAYCKERTGFRTFYLRFFNQLDYSLFSIPHAEKIIRGKEGYLFGEDYILSFLGTNFAGKKFCDEKVTILKKLQDQLWIEKKILLVVIFTPDKGTFFQEYIPQRFFSKKRGLSNYSYYASRCSEAGINTIDFNRWFLLAKDTSRYPLYPKTGVHWSSYGALMAADSLVKYLRSKLKLPLPRIVIDRIETSRTARFNDDDIAQTLNLFWRIPHPAYAYPQFHFTADPTQKKAAALFIGDSFYWDWYNPGVIPNIFSNEEFWYYNQDVYPESRTKPTPVSGINIEEAINRQKIIILMQVNGADGNIGYGFAGMALDALDSAKKGLQEIEQKIRNSPKWMKLIREKAEKAHIPVEEQLRLDARYVLGQEKSKNKPKNN